MRKFLLRSVLFIVPAILLLVPPFFALKTFGEVYTNVDNLIIEKKKYLIGYAYNEQNYGYLKWREVVSRKKICVMALGSSRVLQFRENMFDSSFYNSGYTIRSIADFVPFLKSIPPKNYPSVLVIGLDQWMFNEKWDALSKKRPAVMQFNFKGSAPGVSSLAEVWHDLYHKRYSFREIVDGRNDPFITRIGINAVIKNTGFRNDGSMLYGRQISGLTRHDSTVQDFDFRNTRHRIRTGVERFEFGDKVNEKAVVELDSLLSFCQANHIYVVAFIPPFADGIQEAMEQCGKYEYIKDIYPRCRPVFQKFEFELWDLNRLNTYNSNDSEVIDGFHGGEVTYLKMLIYMIEKGSRLKHYTNLEKLKADQDHKENDYIVYPY